jgi:nucleotide-binding universal stress UspA family protein
MSTSRASTKPAGDRPPAIRPLTRFAVAVDGEPGGHDAFALGRALAQSHRADLLAMTVVPDLSLIAPWAGSDPMHHDIELQMRRMRDEWHPPARIAIDRDRSVARGLGRMVARTHRELLVVGSSHRAEEGRVRLSGHVRQLIGHLPCPLVIAPRGLAGRQYAIHRVGVGLEDSAASTAALAFAARLAVTAGAELLACGVVDDTPPAFGWPSASVSKMRELWSAAIEDRITGVEAGIRERAAALELPVAVEVRRGGPGEVLMELSREVDLLVLGSRRWGPVARLVLGGTGETLVHGSHCPVAIVPRPADGETGAAGAD